MIDDVGFGIDLMLVEWLFEFFVCGDLLCNCVIGGIGLGFVIVCLIVECYGGIVILELGLYGCVCVMLLFV